MSMSITISTTIAMSVVGVKEAHICALDEWFGTATPTSRAYSIASSKTLFFFLPELGFDFVTRMSALTASVECMPAFVDVTIVMAIVMIS